MPLIVDLYLPAEIVNLSPFAFKVTGSFGRLDTNSAKSFAGTVMVPFFFALAFTYSTVANSMLVAIKVSCFSSALKSTLLRIGNPALVLAATRLTTLSALANLSCKTSISIFPPLEVCFLIIYKNSSSISSSMWKMCKTVI